MHAMNNNYLGLIDRMAYAVDTLQMLESLKRSLDSKISNLNNLDIRVKNKFVDIHDSIVFIANTTGLHDTSVLMDLELVLGKFRDSTCRLMRDNDVSLREERDIVQNKIKDMEPVRDFLSKNNNKITCPVCFDKDIDVYANPCGHTFCLECANRMCNEGICYMCKRLLDVDESYRKLYYSK